MSGVIALAIKSVEVETLNANFGVISELEVFIGQNKSLNMNFWSVMEADFTFFLIFHPLKFHSITHMIETH